MWAVLPIHESIFLHRNECVSDIAVLAYLLFLYLEVNVQSVEQLRLDVSQHVFRHSHVRTVFTFALHGLLSNLDSSRIVGYVVVLCRAYQYNVAEPAEAR